MDENLCTFALESDTAGWKIGEKYIIPHQLRNNIVH
jgi:hypothetical protein